MSDIHQAVKYGELDKLRILLMVDPGLALSKDDRGNTPLHYAAANERTEEAKVLLANQADVNAKENTGLTPLHIAALKLRKRMVELLLANKADVNAENHDGVTPVSLVISGRTGNEHLENSVARVLYEHGARY
ncbi:MAG: ankyrin repeat domain-containing protein [Verrucomicrobiota bacterium]|jgi:ankyrin repeat protein